MSEFSFNGWGDVENKNLDTIMDMILTGRNANTAMPDDWLLPFFPNNMHSMLDFGCGIGRNSFSYAHALPEVEITGYDNKAMLSKCMLFYNLRYKNSYPQNLLFNSDWNTIKNKKFDCILAVLVFQHVSESDIKVYVDDFKKITNFVLIVSRRINDHTKQSTWTMLAEYGLIPVSFYTGSPLRQIEFEPNGDPLEHNIGIFNCH